MDFTALVLLLLLAGPVLGGRGDQDPGPDLERLQRDLEALEEKLNATATEVSRQRDKMDLLREENKGLQARLNSTEEELELLKASGDVPGVAFSASLVASGELYKGPCLDRTLVFKRIFSNRGGGYDPDTGSFTAPLDGFYFFTFSTFGYSGHLTGAILVKDGVRQVSTYRSPAGGGSDGGSAAAVLGLRAGESVHVELWEGSRVFDNLNGHTTFSGFLLFAM